MRRGASTILVVTDDVLTLPIPSTLSTTYAVALAGLPEDVNAAATAALAPSDEELADLVRARMSQGLLDVRMIDAAMFPRIPVEMLQQHDPDPATLSGFQTASHFLVVSSTGSPSWPPAHEIAARALSAALAGGLRGVLVDLRTPKLLDPTATAAAIKSAPRLADYVTIAQSLRAGGHWVFSLGLDRFGLPEVQALDVPLPHAAAIQQLLLGLAERLRSLYYEAVRDGEASAVVPAELTVTVADVAAALTAPSRPGGPVTLRLRHGDPDSRPRSVIVEPPAGWAGTDFYGDAAATLFDGVPVSLRMTTQQLRKLFDTGAAG
jgi:hypothetical protein